MTNISNKEELSKLIARYVRGKTSREETLFLRKYYDHFDDRDNGLDGLTEREQAQLKSQIFNQIQSKLYAPQKGRIQFLRRYKEIAAVFVFLVAAAVFWFIQKTENESGKEVVQVQLSPFVVDTAFDLAKHIYLSDGSYVVLEPGSQLKYSRGFSGTEREVFLVGKAYFDVQQDSLRPFVVRTKEVTTRVLGTAFSISSLDTSNEFSISVTRGKVEVLDLTHQLGVLEKDDQLILNRVGQKVIRNRLREEETSVIEPSEFKMNDMTVAEAIGIVEKRWGCKFDIRNKNLKKCRFTTYFKPTDDLEEVVAVIATVIGARYSIKDKLVSLKGEGCD